MSIGERIKKRRKELGISVDDIAKKLNKNRATIYRYESDEIENLSINVLEPLAKALKTTPAHLMGWEKEYQSKKDVNNILDLKEKTLLNNFNKLNSLGKDKAIDSVQDLTQIDKYTDKTEENNKEINLKEELEKLNKENPVQTIAAHNDHWDEPEEMEKVKKDLAKMDDWEW
ncbi:helix-turn-helix domain-containing protein [Metaclostridioides mangenotii]|uniref:Transcriptional regulator with XRE-family HTH domain n=1 Tax=Metaclostridioides mangenotii TaxID=1540 RepID=A0ABS4EBR0_9FIRM|nr:helix-turn-helix domain-containing protein [Clostridioides mangenotii]MBP1855369.1 transcriptional regulator with XRE-family HTH domain [Clostridioides mangenotii]